MPGQEEPAVPEEEQLVPHSGVEPKFGKGKRSNSEWKELMGFPSDEVMEKTLESTTQMQVEPVELERREVPKQHLEEEAFDTTPATTKGLYGYGYILFYGEIYSRIPVRTDLLSCDTRFPIC